MGKPKTQAFRLLRSCLFFSGHKRDKQEAEAMDGEGDVSTTAVSSSPQPPPPPQLPEDIILDVLSRLPVKTLCRFRCVCTSWRALISSPAFASAQASRAAAAPLVAGVFGAGLGTTPRPLDKFRPARVPRFLPDPLLEVRVMDPADGGSVLMAAKDVGSAKLMCAARLGRLVMVDQGERGARVIDPVTGRVMVLDGVSSSTTIATTTVLYSDGRRRRRAAGGSATGDDSDINAVHMCRWLCYNSMGRATPSGAYKVVQLRDGSARNGHVQICHVATVPWPWEDEDGDDDGGNIAMETCWRQRPEPPILACCCSSCMAVVDGVIHFMNHRSPSHNGRPMQQAPVTRSDIYIASFDLESEEWKPTIINGPPLNKDVGWEMSLAALKGSLCLIQTDIIDDNNMGRRYCTKNIWFLVDPERSIWVKQYAIQMTGRSWYLLKPLEILDDGRILMLNAFKKREENLREVPCVLQLYDPSTGALTDLMEMGDDFRGPLTLYTGSLFS